MHRRAAFVAIVLALLGAGTVRAQGDRAPAAPGAGRIVGRVLDRGTSKPVPDVTVRVVGLELPQQVTNADGWFELAAVPRGIQEIEIQHIAYGSKRQLVNVPAGRTVELEVLLSPQPLALEPIEVEVALRNRSLEQEGFYTRREAGWGHYFTYKDLERSELRHVLRRVPGLELRSPGGRPFDRIPVMRVSGRECVPNLFIDGTRIRFLGSGINEWISRENIEAIEVYRGITTPGEFIGFEHRPCGAIVIWTRSGNAP